MIGCKSSLFLAGVLALAGSTNSAHAQLARTYVSSFGNDANDCNRATPCRTFQRAHNQTLGSGEITVLDPGGYGAVTITKNISIINDGVGEAGVLVSGDAIGITVSAGPNDRVSLRGLTVKGIAFGNSNGILFSTGASLTVENCAIRNHSGDGIQMLGNIAAGATSAFTLSNTFVSDNGGNGIYIQPSGPFSGRLRVVLNRVEMYNNSAHGLGLASAGVDLKASVTDSVSSNNGMSGFAISTPTMFLHPYLLVVRSSAAFNHDYGLVAVGPGTGGGAIDISQVATFANGIKGWTFSNGGAVFSYGDNVASEATSSDTSQVITKQ